MKKLIFDRTQADVDRAIELNDKYNQGTLTPEEKIEWDNFLKGTYNYIDLNRIEEWCQYLANALTEYSYPVSITTKTDWTMEDDFPTQAQMNRIRGNIKALKDAYYSFTNLPNANNMTYQKANQFEKILFEINLLFNNMRNRFIYSGVANSGQSMNWQHRFRRYSNMFNTRWVDLSETYWSDFEENETWEGAIINATNS